jgi:hypothetical protein
MNPVSVRTPARKLNLIAVWPIFLIAVSLYVWLYLDPRLIYHGFGRFTHFPVFSWDGDLLKEYLTYPGGIITGLSAFLSQYFYYSWAGTLIITTVVGLVSFCYDRIIVDAGGGPARLLCIVPAFLLMILYSLPNHPLILALLCCISFLFYMIYQMVPTRLELWRPIILLILFVFIYYLAAGASLLFILLIVIKTFLRERRVFIGVCAIVIATIFPYLIGSYILGLAKANAYFGLMGDIKQVIIFQIAMFGIVTIIPAATALWQIVRRKWIPEGKARSFRTYVFLSLPWAVFLIVVGVFFWQMVRIEIVKRIVETRHIYKIAYLSDNEKWTQVLAQVDRAPESDNLYILPHINKALYYTGQLPDKMFSYPQRAGIAVLFPPMRAGEAKDYIHAVDLVYRLGCVNMAEHFSYEVWEGTGPMPQILQKLVEINIIKGSIKTAKIFLRALCKDLIFGRNARKRLQELEENPLSAESERVRLVRSQIPQKDIAARDVELDRILQSLLEHNKKNRMAFEYLMALYLSTKDLESFVKYMPRFRDFGYTRMPRHYAEALLIHSSVNQKSIDFRRFRINPEMVQKCIDFMKTYAMLMSDRAVAWKALAPEFGNSYFFYFMFGRSGVTK